MKKREETAVRVPFPEVPTLASNIPGKSADSGLPFPEAPVLPGHDLMLYRLMPLWWDKLLQRLRAGI